MDHDQQANRFGRTSQAGSGKSEFATKHTLHDMQATECAFWTIMPRLKVSAGEWRSQFRPESFLHLACLRRCFDGFARSIRWHPKEAAGAQRVRKTWVANLTVNYTSPGSLSSQQAHSMSPVHSKTRSHSLNTLEANNNSS